MLVSPIPPRARAEQDHSVGPSPGQPGLYHLGLAWWSLLQLLRLCFCQTPIQHLTSTFIKFVIFLRKPNKNDKHLRTR